MRNHEEVIERLEERHRQYEVGRRRKISRILTASSAVVVLAIAIPLFIHFGNIRKPAGSAPASGTATPTSSAEITPTQEITATPTPVQQTFGELPDMGRMTDDSPNPGVFYVGTTLMDSLRDPAKADGLFHVKLSILLDWEDPLHDEFKQKFEQEYSRNPLYLEYAEGYDRWLTEVYYPSIPAWGNADKGDVIMDKYDAYWKEGHTAEEWTAVQNIIAKIKDEHELKRDFLAETYREERERILAAGVTVLAEDYGYLELLITADQFRRIAPTERFSYEMIWAMCAMPVSEGFESAPEPPAKQPVNPITIDGEKLGEGLAGEHEATDIAKVCLGFGDCWEEGQRILREKYAEEYEAYMWLKTEENPVANDDPRVEKAMRGWELHNSLPQTWELEQEEKFFQRHPEYRQYRPAEADGIVHQLYLKVPYTVLAEIIGDTGVVSITYRPDDIRVVTEIGKLNGTPVYDMRRTVGGRVAIDPEYCEGDKQ